MHHAERLATVLHVCLFLPPWSGFEASHCTTQWRAAFRVKSFKAVVIRGKLSGEGGGGAVGAVGD